jgi:hypothetical protein
MIYMLEVAFVVAAPVFGLAGLFIAALFVWTQATEYARAIRMQRVPARVRREHFAISRPNSRTHDGDSLHVA